MPLEDGLPTYEEATGLERILPHNIARDITRAISQSEEGSSTANKGLFWCLLVLGLILVLALGILMIAVGATNLVQCPQSMLPKWLLGSGSSVVAPYIIVLLFCLKGLVVQRHRFDDGKPQLMAWLVAMDVFFAIIWYCAGCYWTWTSVKEQGEVQSSVTVLSEDRMVKQASNSAACLGHVFWLCVIVTSLPIICIILVICKICYSAFIKEEE